MTRVKWGELDPGLYEDMVAVLLSNIYPDAAERIDGSGGDGGRDVQLRYGADLDGFELKGFTGRMSSGRRAQVKRSLQRAASLGLRSWTLVVPINPTPGEQRWFDSLEPLIGCPITWRGLTWLDARMAERPFVARYFIERLQDEVLALLERLSAENAAMENGVPDALTRVQQLVVQANELDPYYRFEITSDGTSTAVTIIPRYPSAMKDRPIGANVRFRFPKTPEGEAKLAEFQEAMQFGTAVSLSGDFVEHLAIDAPAGLGGEHSGGTVEMFAHVPPDPDRRMMLGAKDGSGRIVARVGLDLTIVSSGQGGAILEGSDRSGAIRVRMRADGLARMINMQLTVLGALPFYPHEMVPVARLLARIKEGDTLVLLHESGEEAGSLEGSFDEAGELMGETFAELVEDFAILQAKAGRIELVQPELTLEDAQNIHNGARWARGGSIAGTWENMTSQLRDDVPDELLQRMATETFPFRIQEPDGLRVVVQGIEYTLGTTTTVSMLSARLSDADRQRFRDGRPEPGSTVTFVPGETDRIETSAR